MPGYGPVYRSFTALALASLMIFTLVPVSSFCQTSARLSPEQQALENYIKRITNQLALNTEQTESLRAILQRHANTLRQLGARQQGQPYSPQVQGAIDDETKAISTELEPVLTDEQKGVLKGINLRVIPYPPGAYPVTIPARAESERPLPESRLIPAVQQTGRNARLTDDQKILHLLDRVTFGPRPGDVDAIKRIGFTAYLDQQLHPEAIDDSELEDRLNALPTLHMSPSELLQFYPAPNIAMQRAKEKNAPPVFGRPQQIVEELLQQKIMRAVDSDRQLQEVMTDFWFNHFNIYAQKGGPEIYLLPAYERDVIRPNALGKFHDLLLAVAQSPAMLFYLDNWLSTSPTAKRPSPAKLPQPQTPPPARKPAQAAAQIRSAEPGSPTGSTSQTPAAPRGPFSASAAASAQTPAAPPKAAPAKPAPPRQGINENYGRELMELHTLGVDGGYTQKDVQEVARCFTGWTIDKPYQDPAFAFKPWMHDSGSKTVLGVHISAGGGISDAKRVIDLLSKSPATAHFVAKELCERFVSDDPPKTVVDKAAQVFLNSDGDIGQVLRAILTSPEFNSPAAFRCKVKSPLEFVASAIRALDGDTDGGPAIQSWINRMGEPLYQYQAPTGYGENSARWVNTGVFLDRLNFAVALANNQIRETKYNPDLLFTSSALRGEDQLTNQLTAVIVHSSLSANSRKALQVGLKDLPNSSNVGPGRPGPREAAYRSESGRFPANQQPAARPGVKPPNTEPGARLTEPERRRIAETMALLMGTAEFQRK